jgi:ferrochelatase
MLRDDAGMSTDAAAKRQRTAVVLFNLGGPDSLAAVRPFLYNLFKDPAILGVPAILRRPLAWLIARRRTKVAEAIYARIGGRSPLVGMTRAQALLLRDRLEQRGIDNCTFIAMRYWHPMAAEAASAVADYAPTRIVLLPLYPQFSTTTTASSIGDWQRAAAAAGLALPTTAICCYPAAAGFIAAVAGRIRATLADLPADVPVRVLFSAHGLPKRVIDRGDPYQWQVEKTVAAVVDRLGDDAPEHVICYQSRVGPLKWIGPSTEAEIERAARDGRAIVVVPIAFVSEHSETLVELDIEYRELAERLGVRIYLRVPTVADDVLFIDGLADLVEQAIATDADVVAAGGARICADRWSGCPCRSGPAGNQGR